MDVYASPNKESGSSHESPVFAIVFHGKNIVAAWKCRENFSEVLDYKDLVCFCWSFFSESTQKIQNKGIKLLLRKQFFVE